MTQPNTSDATYCARCGGAFGSIRLIVDGKAYHQLCAIVDDHPKQKDENASLKATLQEVEQLSDNCVNAEHYTAENAINDLQAIRSVIKRTALETKP